MIIPTELFISFANISRAKHICLSTEGFMAGVVPLANATYLPGHCSNNSLSCGSPACGIVRSNTSSSSSTRQHGVRNRACRVPYQQLHHNNDAFGSPSEKRSTKENSKTKESLLVRSMVLEMTPEVTRKYDPYSHLQVGTRWREIQGESRWRGLFGDHSDLPFDPVLRGELIRYGEFTQAAYDSFDYNEHSPYCGTCKYSRARFFEKMGLEHCGYEVTDYIYATAGQNVALAKLAKYFKFMDLVGEQGNEVDQKVEWDLETNWIGYVAVTTDPKEIKRLGRRDIVVVWRGTVTKLEWLENLRNYTSPSGLDPRREGLDGLKIEAGFLELYKSFNPKSRYTHMSARRQVLEAITKLVRKYANEELSITVCGHSLGSALAMLAGYDIAESGVNQATNLPDRIAHWDEPDDEKLQNPDQVVEWTQSEDAKTVPVTVYSWGGPRVGNDAFRQRVEDLGVNVLRVVNLNDMVVKVPGIMINERIQFHQMEGYMDWFHELLDNLPWTYSHVGVPLYINNMTSPFLIKTKNPDLAHNLEGYLHVLSGFHGAGKDWKPAIFRDLALVNKACDFIEKRHYFPASWWQEANKGLTRTEDGRWIPRSREEVDKPEYDLDDQYDADVTLPPKFNSIREFTL